MESLKVNGPLATELSHAAGIGAKRGSLMVRPHELDCAPPRAGIKARAQLGSDPTLEQNVGDAITL